MRDKSGRRHGTREEEKKRKPPVALFTLFFVVVVFCIFLFTVFIVAFVGILLARNGILTIEDAQSPHFGFLIFEFALASVAVGTVLTVLLGRIPLKPINGLIRGLNRLADGDYRTKLDLGDHRLGRELSESFNALASELQNTEMLRSDFINNFSHEFKTPIVSILGFARLLNRDRDGLSEQQRREYLTIIEEEAERLSAMATNVLDLTKIENQNILTGCSVFNLSEQLRTCILLLEKKWISKEISISVDFQEYDISANEELLKQVWINLLDNAVKFTPQGGEIEVRIRDREGFTQVSIRNTGSEISEEGRERIFRKFYQGDSSHSSEGTGLGLSIARKIAELHGGTISAGSENGSTEFTVELPKSDDIYQ